MNVTFRFCFRSPLKSLKLPVFKGLFTDLGSHSFLHISFYPLYAEDGKKLISILNSAPSEVESSIQKFPVSAISMGNMKLQACLSDDHQFVATQLLAFKDFGYQPVTEMVTYTGKTAEAFAQLF